MITALATQYAGYIKLAITYPERVTPVYKYVINRREANMLVYTLYRAYIFKKLNGFLRQRMYCLNMADVQLARKAAQLQAVLLIHEKVTLRNICAFVSRNRAGFEQLAPGSRSRFYKHFINRITPVLNFCDEIGGEL